jgi:hypothetical protein
MFRRQSASTLRLILEDVTVQQAREREGDRPYFPALWFRSKLNTRNSTQVQLREQEPHDWVSKPEWNKGRLLNADHMMRGSKLPIPAWMGQHNWENITIIPRQNPDGRVNPQILLADIAGVLVISLDNNNTPPHVIRGILEKMMGVLKTILIEQVERGGVMRGLSQDAAAWNEALMARMSELSKNLYSDMDKAGYFLQLTVGSTFNPDWVTGAQLFIFPMTSGFEPRRTTVPQTMAGSTFDTNTLIMTPQNLNETLSFSGSGARYSVRSRIVVETPNVDQLIPRLIVRIRTGGDNLRGGNDNATLRIYLRNGRTEDYPLNASAEWGSNSNHEVSIQLPLRSRRPRSEIRGFGLVTNFGGGVGGENWDVDSITIESPSAGLLLSERGTPLIRFTGERHEKEWPIRS